MKTELKVDQHASGRLTLKRRNPNEKAFIDYPPGPLFGNADLGIFYRAVAQEIADLTEQGYVISYIDTQLGLRPMARPEDIRGREYYR